MLVMEREDLLEWKDKTHRPKAATKRAPKTNVELVSMTEESAFHEEAGKLV
ncbi:hypothetical protein [Cohnella faecalis]|nr:hypothetical protein [Cohnella faecalis]